MPRPQKYTDSDIAAAIQALAIEGGDVNPMRVRMRLGGGNVRRIKAVLAKGPRTDPLTRPPAAFPENLLHEAQLLSSATSQQIAALAKKCWAAGSIGAADNDRHESDRLSQEIGKLEERLRAAAELATQLERQCEEKERALNNRNTENSKLGQTCEGLRAALRNAESDLRAAQRVIDTFERNQRQDREEARALQKRIEGLVGEIAVLKARRTASSTRKAASSLRSGN